MTPIDAGRMNPTPTELNLTRDMTRLLSCAIIVSGIAMAGFLFAGESFEYNAKGKRDPFVPLVSKDGMYVSDAYGISSIKDIRLEGIVWDKARGSIAIINGEIAYEGQKIGVAEVVTIEKDAVVFNIDNQEIRIELISD